MTKRIFTVAAADSPSPVTFVAQRLHVEPSASAALFEAGAVSANGRRITERNQLAPGDRVVVSLSPPRVLDEPRIVYADDWLLAVDKPAGWLSQPSAGDARSLEGWLAVRHPTARLLHRIDRETSGLVLFSLRADTHRPLQRLLFTGQLLRHYLALVDGVLDGDGVIELRIARHSEDVTRRQWLPANAPGGLAARTSYRARHLDARRSRVELELHSGRTHQARLHLAGVGHPVVGDTLYGGSIAPRLFLHARRLELPHPHDGRPLVVETALPDGFS